MARVASILTLLVALVAGGALVSARFARSVDPDRYARLSIWRAGIGMVVEHPILGVGPGNLPHEASRHNFERREDPIRFGRSFKGAHGALLTHAVEDGVPAALLVLATALVSIPLLWRQRGPGRLADVSQGTALAFAALLAQALVEDLQQRPALPLTAALLLGSSLAAARGWHLEGPRQALRPLVAAGLLVIGCYLGIAGIARPYLGWVSAEAARAAGRAGLPSMRHAAATDPWNAEYHHDLAMAALNSAPPGPEPYAEALEELQEARRLKPRDHRFPMLLARLESRAGRVIFDDASREAASSALYAEATRLAPLDPRPWLERAAHLDALGRTEEALPILEGALAIEPHYRRARILKTELLSRLGRAGEARASYAELLETDRVLLGYEADSGYASEIVSDEPGARVALQQLLEPPGSALADSATR
jgi:tetratricopeptide (TPR) repeat protein